MKVGNVNFLSKDDIIESRHVTSPTTGGTSSMRIERKMALGEILGPFLKRNLANFIATIKAAVLTASSIKYRLRFSSRVLL